MTELPYHEQRDRKNEATLQEPLSHPSARIFSAELSRPHLL